MFSIDRKSTNENRIDDVGVKLLLSKDDEVYIVRYGISFAIVVVFALHIISTLTAIRGPSSAILIIVMSIPFLSIGYELNPYSEALVSNVFPIFNFAQSFRIVNGYGLFRRMTGVANHNYSYTDKWGWGGLSPSIVHRPEIIIEGLFGDEWNEINFSWKPGDIGESPRQVAPHQPRLDWQMWFAALGHYQHNPWLIHLMYKILDGCQPVVNLLGDNRLKKGMIPSKVRAHLYFYDFTRIDTSWSKRIPNILLERSELERKTLSKNFFQFPNVYWNREYVREYIPEFTKHDLSVHKFLSHHGYDKRCGT